MDQGAVGQDHREQFEDKGLYQLKSGDGDGEDTLNADPVVRGQFYLYYIIIDHLIFYSI